MLGEPLKVKGDNMAESTGKGRGWHGDSEGHAKAGQKGGRKSRNP